MSERSRYRDQSVSGLTQGLWTGSPFRGCDVSALGVESGVSFAAQVVELMKHVPPFSETCHVRPSPLHGASLDLQENESVCIVGEGATGLFFPLSHGGLAQIGRAPSWS
ncbi:hypothetical protein BH11PSE3_BH11PSE3_51130 [soil metagenome]